MRVREQCVPPIFEKLVFESRYHLLLSKVLIESLILIHGGKKAALSYLCTNLTTIPSRKVNYLKHGHVFKCVLPVRSSTLNRGTHPALSAFRVLVPILAHPLSLIERREGRRGRTEERAASGMSM